MQKCGNPFHTQVGTKEFMNAMVLLLHNKDLQKEVSLTHYLSWSLPINHIFNIDSQESSGSTRIMGQKVWKRPRYPPIVFWRLQSSQKERNRIPWLRRSASERFQPPEAGYISRDAFKSWEFSLVEEEKCEEFGTEVPKGCKRDEFAQRKHQLHKWDHGHLHLQSRRKRKRDVDRPLKGLKGNGAKTFWVDSVGGRGRYYGDMPLGQRGYAEDFPKI